MRRYDGYGRGGSAGVAVPVDRNVVTGGDKRVVVTQDEVFVLAIHCGHAHVKT